MDQQRTPRRWEGKETQDGKRDIPEQYWDMGYEKWRDRYRTTNVAMSTLKPRKEVQDGFPVGPNGERLEGFFDAGFHADELRAKYADSGMNDRGIRGAVAGDLQTLFNTRRAALDDSMKLASGPDFHRLTLLRDAEQASLGEHIARLHDRSNADQLIETAKDRFADLQAYDLQANHPIANPDRDLVKAPPGDQERFNWLFGRDGGEHGFRKSPAPGDMFEQDEYNTLIHTDRSSDRGVSVRQIEQLPRPAFDVDVSVREAIRHDAMKAVEDLKEAQAYAETLKKDVPPTFEPRAFKETPFQAEPDFRPRATEDGERFYRGTLRGLGEEVRQGDPTGQVLPFAQIEGRNGEDWKVFGPGVPLSIKAASLAVGDDIEIRKMNLDQGGRWVAKAHDFVGHEQEQKEEHGVAEATRKDVFQQKEAQRFEKFEAEALAWKERNPQVEERLAGWLNGPQQTGEAVEQRERRARPALDRVLGRAAPEPIVAEQAVQPDVSAPAPTVIDNDSIASEVQRLRAERDERLGLNQGARPATVAPEVNPAAADAKPQIAQAAAPAPASPVAPAPAVSGALADEVERLRAERDQRLGLNRGERTDAPVPNLDQVAAKVEPAPGAVKPDTEQDQGDGKRQSQGGAGAVGVPSVAEAKPEGVEHGPEVSNGPARVTPPNLAGLASKVDARADAVAQEPAAPAVDAKPVVEQPAAHTVREPVGEHVQPEVKADVKPEHTEQSTVPKLPSLAGIGERVDARAQTVVETAIPAVEPKVDAPAVAQAQPHVQPEAPKVEAAQAVEPKVEQPVQQPAAQPVAQEAPAVAQAQPQAQPDAVQPASHEKPANLPDRTALAIKLSAEIKLFSAEHDASMSNYAAASDRGAAQTKKLEEARVQDVARALQPEQDVAHSQSQDLSGSNGMRMRMRHSL